MNLKQYKLLGFYENLHNVLAILKYALFQHTLNAILYYRKYSLPHILHSLFLLKLIIRVYIT